MKMPRETNETERLVPNDSAERQNNNSSGIKSCLCRNKKFLAILLVASIVVSCTIFIGYHQTKVNKDLMESLVSSDQYADSSHSDVQPLSDNTQGDYLDIGIREGNQLNECQEAHSFPNIDYALMGYNILRGYPLATGHDPGFTFQIFAANYENGKHTADCRYSVPQGFAVVPDVSCITSFTSETIQTQYQFANALSASAIVSDDGWGAKYSASAGHKESFSEIATGESVHIISSANCHYYFSKLIKESPPALDPVFIEWITRLSETKLYDTYFEFFDTYGTHFPTEVTFGARFAYDYKMSRTAFEKLRNEGVDVDVSASYSSIISVGGGSSMSPSQKEKASEFSKSVETKAISVGAAPPANADAMTWASTVKNSPVPSTYKLSSIEELFTEKYLNGAKLNVNLTHIANTIKKIKYAYCKSLESKDEVESCQSLLPELMLNRTRLANHNAYKKISYKGCIDYCSQLLDCVAITYCHTCNPSEPKFYGVCFIYNTSTQIAGQLEDGWESVFFITILKENLALSGTEVIGNERDLDKVDKRNMNREKCEELCEIDADCIVYSYGGKVEQKCKLYSYKNVEGLKKESTTMTVFVKI